LILLSPSIPDLAFIIAFIALHSDWWWLLDQSRFSVFHSSVLRLFASLFFALSCPIAASSRVVARRFYYDCLVQYRVR